MKHTFARKALLMGVATLAINTVPLSAMQPAPSPAVQQQISAQAQVVENLPEKEQESALNRHMKTLNRHWSAMMRCLSGKEGCTKGQVGLVIGALALVMGTVRGISGRRFRGETSLRSGFSAGTGWLGTKATEAQGYVGRQATAARGFASRQTAAARARIARTVLPGTSRAYATEPGAYR